jgi:hypothetical protein
MKTDKKNKQPTFSQNEKIRTLTFSSVYPLYIEKIERKGRHRDELIALIEWLTGFDEYKIREMSEQHITFEDFFKRAKLHPNVRLIQGTICGYKVHEIENELTRKVRYLDLIVDELARGKKLSVIMRT